jgi:integrase/recombinase XerC
MLKPAVCQTSKGVGLMAQDIHRLPLRRTKPVNDIHQLDDWITRFGVAQRSRNLSPKTQLHYAYTFKDFFQFLDATDRPRSPESLEAQTLREFAQWLIDTPTRAWRSVTTRSISSVHGRLRDMRAFTRWLEEEELIDRAPKVKLPKLPQEEFPIVTEAQLQVLFASEHLSAPGPQAVRNRALVALMLDTGLRRAEVAGIELPDLDMNDQLVVVRGKGNKMRRVPFSTGVATQLECWLVIRGEADGRLFWLTSEGIYSLFRRINNETGLTIHPHALRHTAATMLVRANTDLHTVKRILGHSQLSTTEQYLSLSMADLRAKHAAGSPFEQIRVEVTPPEPAKRKRLTLY